MTDGDCHKEYWEGPSDRKSQPYTKQGREHSQSETLKRDRAWLLGFWKVNRREQTGGLDSEGQTSRTDGKSLGN